MEPLITPQALAELTGLALQTIYNRHSNGGSLPECLKLGRLLRFRARDVEAWLDGHYESVEIKPLSQLEPASTTPRRRGRPTKAEQIARRQSGKGAGSRRQRLGN